MLSERDNSRISSDNVESEIDHVPIIEHDSGGDVRFYERSSNFMKISQRYRYAPDRPRCVWNEISGDERHWTMKLFVCRRFGRLTSGFTSMNLLSLSNVVPAFSNVRRITK